MKRWLMMRRWLVVVLGSIITIGAIGTGSAAASSNGNKVFQFQTMVGVSGPFVGATNPIRGVNGGGLPWQISSASGKLSSSGKLEVTVKGLVLLDAPPVPDALQGTNPIANFVAIVSCTTTVGGAPATVNVASDPAPATTTGNAKIEAHVNLPSPCFAPIIFVGPAPTTWFAVTGLG
ncbi:MAG TPA: hypothetical protein VFR11_18490 [Micromonosporaceae bacterium]|jgi:hypothetical protein|nr:hypothetical protein [Micromonosporaceae bacterium]